MATINYVFKLSPTVAGQTASVYDRSGNQVATGVLDGNATLSKALPVGDYEARASYGYRTYASGGEADRGDLDGVTESAVSAAAGAAGVNLASPFVRMVPSLFPKWIAARENVRNGVSDAKILVAGDSTTFGQYGLTENWVYKLTQRLAADPLIGYQFGGTTPSTNTSNQPRYVAGTGWPSTRNYGFGSQGYQYSTPAGTLTYADSLVTADRFDVYHVKQPGSTSLTLQVNNETPVVVDTTGAVSASIVKSTVTVAAAAGTGHVLKITASGTGAVLFVEPWLSTAKRVRVANGGVASSSAETWNTGSGIYSRSLAISYAPDLYVIMLGVNDGVSNRTPAQFRSYIDGLITNKPTTADVLLVSPVPPQANPEKDLVPMFARALRSRGDVGFIDLASWAGSWTAWNSAGYMLDARHPNPDGMEQIANLVYAGLSLV